MRALWSEAAQLAQDNFDSKPPLAGKTAPATPLFQQVKDHIIENIVSGSWLPQSRVPSEAELVASLGLSRMTVNRALRELAAEGFVERMQGVGTFVARRKPQSALLEIHSISEDIAQHGGSHSAEVHILQSETAGREVAEALGLQPGDEVFHSLLVHRDRGRPVQLADRYVNPLVAPRYLEQDFTRITPSQYLFQMGPLEKVEHIIESQLPDRRTQRLLKIGSNEPCLVIKRRTWCKGQVAVKARLVHPGSRFRLAGQFTPPKSNQPLVV